MRQAGRFLPEYRELRAKHSMLEAIRTPELATEITLQPLRRFDLDAGIIFADILTPLIGMGINIDFVQGEGPKIFNPIKSSADIQKLRLPPPEENVGYTLAAIKMVSGELTPKGIPLIGFSGAPFTLSCYLLEEESPSTAPDVKRFMLQERAAWETLQQKLARLVADYLVAQAESGASALQLFDSWVGALAPAEFEVFVAPHLRAILQQVKSRTEAPVVYFGTGTNGLLPLIADLGYDVVGIDWRISLADAARLLPTDIPVQGNLDPLLLANASPAYLEGRVRDVLRERTAFKHHVFNLGHGIVPHTPPDNVTRVLEIVHSER